MLHFGQIEEKKNDLKYMDYRRILVLGKMINQNQCSSKFTSFLPQD